MPSYSQSQPFTSTRNLALWTTILLGTVLLLDVINILLNIVYLFLASTYPDALGAMMSEEDQDFTELPGGTVVTVVAVLTLGMTLFTFASYIATIILFLVWMHRSYRNLKPLGAYKLEYSTVRAIGSWFIPFVNLAQPFSIIKEIWNKSNPNTVELGNTDYGQSQTLTEISAPMFGLWWAFWLLSNFASNISFRLSYGAKTLADNLIAFRVDIVSSTLSVVAAFLAITVVRAITARQEECHKRQMMNTMASGYSDTPPFMQSPMPPNFA